MNKFETTLQKAGEEHSGIKDLLDGGFVLDSESDVEHDVYTGKCLVCAKEFSIHVAKGFKGTDKKNLDQVTQKILESKKCQLCREK
ncbi:hypothetical protein HN670_02430 [bacterium]|jgi:hypothetical protein|nr:hypothetical protein [bacterium]